MGVKKVKKFSHILYAAQGTIIDSTRIAVVRCSSGSVLP